MQRSAARIEEIDISRPARALAVLRWSDYVLVVGCGLGALGFAVQLVLAAVGGADYLLTTAMAAALGYAAYAAWRHVGVIDPRVWRSYVWVLPLLACLSALAAVAVAVDWRRIGFAQRDSDLQAFSAIVTYLQFAAVALPGFVCVLRLRRMRVLSLGVPLTDVLASLNAHAGTSAASQTALRSDGRRRGVAYGVCGLALVLAANFAPMFLHGRPAEMVLRVSQAANLSGFFVLIRARRYFQVSADALLAVDKRAPILFLRSFADDERQRYGSSQRALLDFSLETRLANHFHRFGPFIAIGSPKDTVPQPGAARVLLSDEQWQPRVLDWMRAASVIIMYCGTTHWVNWELRQIVELGRATSLILMFPESRGWRPSRRQRDIAARTAQIRTVFQDTAWTEELTEFGDFTGLRAMLFRADGSMLMIKSRSRSRDAYHLAALIAHQQLLDPAIGAVPAGARAGAPARSRVKRIAAAVAVAAVAIAALGFYVVASSSGNRLAFHRGELYFDDAVTEAEAKGVGAYLVEQEIFSDQRAATVQLEKAETGYRLRFVITPAAIDAPLTSLQFGALGSDIARHVLKSDAIEVALCDDHLRPVKVVPPSVRVAFGKSELYYTHPIAADDAFAVGQHLKAAEYFSDERPTSVHLSREDNTYQLRFVVHPSRANDRDTIDAFNELAAAIADRALGAAPVVVQLCDDAFRTLHSERLERRVAVSGRR